MKTKEQNRATQRRWYKNHPENKRSSNLLRRYGLTLEDYEKMFVEQDGKCAICFCSETKTRNGKILPLCVDHDHATGKPRALLCNSCNRGLGGFKDNPLIIRSAVDYAEKYSRVSSVGQEQRTCNAKVGSSSLSPGSIPAGGQCWPEQCTVPPEGWTCSRKPGHDGPCAARPTCDACGLPEEPNHGKCIE